MKWLKRVLKENGWFGLEEEQVVVPPAPSRPIYRRVEVSATDQLCMFTSVSRPSWSNEIYYQRPARVRK